MARGRIFLNLFISKKGNKYLQILIFSNMKNINFKNFSLQNLEGSFSEIRIINIANFNKKINYSISDYIEFSVSSGSENLYLNLTIYDVNGVEPLMLRIFTKENHKGLKNFIAYLIML